MARFAKRLLSDREDLQNDLTDIRKYLDRVDSYVERNGHALKEVTAEYEALRQELEESRRREVRSPADSRATHRARGDQAPRKWPVTARQVCPWRLE